MLDSRHIIEGAFYAMEQAGLILNDAATLYGQRKWPSSLVLSVFSLEELGKAEMLLQRGIEAAASGPKSKKQVMTDVAWHRTRLKAGRGEATVTATVSFWGDIPAPSIPENAALEAQLDTAQVIATENAPGEDHAARMRALYVDVDDEEMWVKPKDTGPSEAYLMVSAASVEYQVRRGKFVAPASTAVIEAVARLGGLIPALPEAPTINWPNA